MRSSLLVAYVGVRALKFAIPGKNGSVNHLLIANTMLAAEYCYSLIAIVVILSV